MGQNLDALLRPGPRIYDPEPTVIEEVTAGLTLEERVAADEVERERLLAGPLYGYRVPIDTDVALQRPMARTLALQAQREREGARTVAIVWGTVILILILGALA